MATATADDVRLEDGNAGVIATDLSDAEIEGYLDDAEYEAQAAIANYDTALSTEDKRQLEKYLAALLIRTISDKAISSTSRETASVSYEGGGMTTMELRKKVSQRDPSGSLASNVLRDTSRYVSSTDES